MVAVVDRETPSVWIKIGPATAAGARGLVHDDLATGVGKAHGRAQARDARPDDMDGAGGHGTPYRRSAPSTRRRLAFARRRGRREAVARPSGRESSRRPRPSAAARAPPRAAPAAMMERAFVEMPARARGDLRAGGGRAAGRPRPRAARRSSRPPRQAPRAADRAGRRRVLVDVAQDVGQLQRAAEMMGERFAGLGAHAEDRAPKAARRRSRPDRSRDPGSPSPARGCRRPHPWPCRR